MKKGCFIKAIIILTILVAVFLYIVQYHLDDLIINPTKNFFSELFVSGVEKELTFIEDTPEKDSLRVLLKNYLKDKFTETKELSNKDINWLIDSVKVVVQDSIISMDDLNKIKNIIELKGYEGSKEN